MRGETSSRNWKCSCVWSSAYNYHDLDDWKPSSSAHVLWAQKMNEKLIHSTCPVTKSLWNDWGHISEHIVHHVSLSHSNFIQKEMQLLGFVDIRLTHMSRTPYSAFNKKQLQFPAYKCVKKPTRRSGQWHYNSLVTFSFQANQIFLQGWNQTSKRMFQPSAAPVLICYLASSWLVIFCPQVEPSTSA